MDRAYPPHRLAAGRAMSQVLYCLVDLPADMHCKAIFPAIKTEAVDRPPIYPKAEQYVRFHFALQHKIATNKFTGEVLEPHYFTPEDETVPLVKENEMSWKTPKIVEVPVGMEINMYACAARK